jgi:hypothetical protein
LIPHVPSAGGDLLSSAFRMTRRHVRSWRAVRLERPKPESAVQRLEADELVRRAVEQGLSLTGPEGLLKQPTK